MSTTASAVCERHACCPAPLHVHGCFADDGRCNHPLDHIPGWRAALPPTPAYHHGVLYGIRHPGVSQEGCPFCASTLAQRDMMSRWLGLTPEPTPEDREHFRRTVERKGREAAREGVPRDDGPASSYEGVSR